uniref:Odorant-binding protein n=1 Tax=Callosobruchus chinensis TaxID=146774 RepID=A0A7M4CGL5_CALCS|nr:odorant-binding protein [Callosobruchus chinensis]
MKAFVVAAVICAVAVLVKAELTEEQKEKLKKHHQECLAETKVDEELVKKARQGDFTEDQKLKDHMFCVVKKIGFLDDAGEIKMDVLKVRGIS